MIFIGDGGYYGCMILLNMNNLTRFEEGVFKSVMQEKYQSWYFSPDHYTVPIALDCSIWENTYFYVF